MRSGKSVKQYIPVDHFFNQKRPNEGPVLVPEGYQLRNGEIMRFETSTDLVSRSNWAMNCNSTLTPTGPNSYSVNIKTECRVKQ